MSQSLRDGKTRGLLDGLTNWAMGDISRRLLKASQQWYLYPLHVPVILLGIFFDHAAWEVDRLLSEVEKIEYLSRDAGIGSLQQFDTITTELQYLKRDFGFLQSLTKFLLETMDFLEKKIYDRESGAQGGRDGIQMYVYQTNPHMEEKLTNTLHLIENNLETVEYLQARTTDALDFIKGKISLRDNTSDREDADSNKTMSFLQMVFLPATFVAAIVSMNFFDLTTSPPKVSSYIWVFIVVALLLTGLVLGIYFLWKWRTKMKIKAEERESKRKEKEMGWDNPGSAGGSGSGGGGYATGSDAEDRGKKRRRRRRSSGRYDDSAGEDDGKAGKKHKEKSELVM